uniref:Uncharacterized protein n=1 Tax=Oryza punctata TaxID=4537 RepID=A0A0E0MCA8_ORYPU
MMGNNNMIFLDLLDLFLLLMDFAIFYALGMIPSRVEIEWEGSMIMVFTLHSILLHNILLELLHRILLEIMFFSTLFFLFL